MKRELGWYRRNWLVPVPEADDLEGLNRQLPAACVASRGRTIIGRNMTIAEACQLEQPHLLPLAEEVFGIHETIWPLTVDGKGCVRVKTNWYSTPLWPGRRVTARVWPTFISVEHDGKSVATHPRNYGRGHQIHRHHQLKTIAASNGMIYHRTVNSLLTVCLTHRDNPTFSPWSLAHSSPNICPMKSFAA